MIYRILADLVVGAHFTFVLFVVGGVFLVLRWPRLAWLHIPAAVWGALIELAGWICPLTPLEGSLRRQAGGEGYRGGFIDHYILPILYPGDLTRTIQVVLGLLVILINAVGYYLFWRKHWRGSAAV